MNGSHSNNNKLKKNASKQNPQQFTRAFFYCELINHQCAVLLLLDLFFFLLQTCWRVFISFYAYPEKEPFYEAH